MVLKCFRSLVNSHITFIRNQILPIQKRQTTQNVSPNKFYHFGFQLLILISVTTYGTLYLPLQEAGFDLSILDFNTLSTNEFVFTHQMVPRSLWRTFDIVAFLTVLVSVGILLMSAFREELDPRYQMYVSTSEESTGQHYFIGDLPLQPSSAKLAEQINALQQKVPLLLWSTFAPLYTVLMTFYYTNILLHGVYTVSAFSLLFWAILLPAWTLYLCIALFGSMLYIVLSSRVLRLRQESLLKRFQNLLSSSRNKQCSTMGFIIRKYRRFVGANGRLLAICRHIEENSQFSNPVLSTLLPQFMIVPPFMLTVFLATSTNFFPSPDSVVQQGLLDKIVCFTCVLECNAGLYCLVNECSALDWLNGQMETTLRQFNFEFCFKKRLKDQKLIKLPLLMLLKAESLQSADRLKPYTYCAFGSFRIVARSYFSVSFVWVVCL